MKYKKRKARKRIYVWLCMLTLIVCLPWQAASVSAATTKKTSGAVLVKQTEDDRQVIPDKYNTGATGELTQVGLGDAVEGVKLIPVNDGTKNCLDFFNRNTTVSEAVTFENYDFSRYPVVIYHSEKVTRDIKLIFKNCKFSSFFSNRNSDKIALNFSRCTFQHFYGSNAELNQCKFGESFIDGVVPFCNVTVKNSLFHDLGSKKSENHILHSDGTQIYGWEGISVRNIFYKNCRFEIPPIAPEGSKATVNACIMLQLEYSSADSMKFEDCIVNGGGYSIYARSKFGNYTLNNVSFKNIQVGCAKKYGTYYPNISSDVSFDNVTETGALYVGSVWKKDGKTHLSVTNDTCRKRKLLVITDQGKYRYTIPACKKGSEMTAKDLYTDMPFDKEITIPKNCKYLVCFDNTFSGSARQIRYVNWCGKKVYLSKKENSTLYSGMDELIASGECGENVKYTLTKAGLLTLKGKGETYSYNSSKVAPWMAYSDMIRQVKVEKGVTGLGNQLFLECYAIRKASLPGSLCKIGNRTFWGCSSLLSIKLPKSVNDIGDNAFSVWTRKID